MTVFDHITPIHERDVYEEVNAEALHALDKMLNARGIEHAFVEPMEHQVNDEVAVNVFYNSEDSTLVFITICDWLMYYQNAPASYIEKAIQRRANRMKGVLE